jgi:hypothetical protein
MNQRNPMIHQSIRAARDDEERNLPDLSDKFRQPDKKATVARGIARASAA